MRMRLAVIIVNYRTPALVTECLDSLDRQLERGKDVAVVVDNGSGDGSADDLERTAQENGWQGWVKIVRAERNDGFSAGNNIGIEAVDAEAYWLLNSDTIVKEGAVESLLAALEARPDAGLVSARLDSGDGGRQTNCFRNPSPVGELIKGAQTGAVTKWLQRFDVPMPQSDEPRECDWTGFASVVIRREVFRDVGPLDEGYFMYFEDVDFCRRAREKGWRILHWPQAAVVHLHGQSGPVVGATEARQRRPRYFYASRARYFAKFYGRVGLWTANGCWLLGAVLAVLQQVLGHKKDHFCRREFFDIWTNAHRPLRTAAWRDASRPPPG